MTAIEQIKKLVELKLGLNFDKIEKSDFDVKLTDYLSVNNLESIEKLCDIIKNQYGELVKFAENILVNKSYFFHNQEIFDDLNAVINSILIDKQNDIEILSVGSAQGEIPYSIAIFLIELGINQNRILIDAIDFSPYAIEIAKQAVYHNSSIHFMNQNLVDKYFQRAEELFILNPKIAHLVNFHTVNFIKPNIFTNKKYDIIILSNILSSLTNNAVSKLLNNIISLLNDNSIVITTEQQSHLLLSAKFRKSKCGKHCFAIPEKEETPLSDIKKEPKKNRLISKVFRFDKKYSVATTIKKPENKHLNNTDCKTIRDIRQLLSSGNIDFALSLCLKLLDNDKKNPDIYYLLGNIYEQKKEIETAEDYYHKALYLEPFHYDSLVKLILLFENQGMWDKAEFLKLRLDKITGKQ